MSRRSRILALGLAAGAVLGIGIVFGSMVRAEALSLAHLLAVAVILLAIALIATVGASLHARSTSSAQMDELDNLRAKASDLENAVLLSLSSHAPLRLLGTPVETKWQLSMIAPDLANFLIQWILARRPRRVLECGSGFSTLVIAKCLRELGSGELLSLEHNASYADVVRQRVSADGLDSTVQIHTAPVVPLTFADKVRPWYDAMDAVREFGTFDLCLIDGPPGFDSAQPGRAGALYALWENANVGAQLVLDDGVRDGERACITEWTQTFGNRLRVEYLDFVKGAWLITKVTP